jgi:hypothetical protein
MMQGRNQKRRVRILVKAFPQPSAKHEETVCCAGVSDDGRELLRLFPIRYRRLPKGDQFDRYDLVEMTITKASDPRPESYRVDEGSIRLIEKDKLADESKVRLWRPFIAPSIGVLIEENKTQGRSLGIIRPKPESLKFIIKEAKESNAEDQEVADLVFAEQTSLLEDPLKPLEKPRYSFSYQFICADPTRCTCSNNPHTHQVHDWEVQATYFNYKRKYQTEEEVLAKMMQVYQDDIPMRNLHFIMGTMAAHPRTFIVIGLLRSGFDPAELSRQGELF